MREQQDKINVIDGLTSEALRIENYDFEQEMLPKHGISSIIAHIDGCRRQGHLYTLFLETSSPERYELARNLIPTLRHMGFVVFPQYDDYLGSSVLVFWGQRE